MGLLDGKVAIITGAGHGVGRGYALDMAAAGAKIVVNDLGGSTRGEGSDARAADVVVDIIKANGGEAVANYEDVSDFEGAKRMVRQAIDTFGGLDTLVLNAGILRDKMIFNMDEADWDAVIKVHMKGHFAPARHACEYWRDRSKEIGGPVNASVICTSSSVGLHGNVGQTNYSAAKGGIAMFAIALSHDMERYGVRANCIAPSGTTRLIGTIPGRDLEILEPDEYAEFSPRNPGNVAPLIVWLSSDQAQHVTGQVYMYQGESIIHYHPWTRHVVLDVPGGGRKWNPEEIGPIMNANVFHSRHPGLWAGLASRGASVV
ncbi:MAG: SDR family NAD(P)-dependent oxidoreductase [Acidimicrobiia bacterium]